MPTDYKPLTVFCKNTNMSLIRQGRHSALAVEREPPLGPGIWFSA